MDENELTEEQLEAQAEAEKAKQRQKEEMLEGLAQSIESKFAMRAARRALKEQQWLRSTALYFGKLAIDSNYTRKETPFEASRGTNRPDVNIVRSKCSIAIAQSVSMQFGTSEKNWDLFPEKKDRSTESAQGCQLMSDEIDSQLGESKYSFHCRKAMWYRVIMGTGIMKGPVNTGKVARSYQKMEGSSTWVPSLSVDYSPTVWHVNPWFFYPDETADEVCRLNDTIEVHPKTALELKKLMSHEGFIPDAIAEVLEQRPAEYQNSNWADYATLTESNPHLFKDRYSVLEYHGPITRSQLNKLDIECSYDSINDEYYGEVWVCQGKVIRIELENIEASFRVPYYMSVWEKDPSSVFGFGVPLMMEDAQRVVNESWHMILDNSSISSGPQVAMQRDLIEPANGKWEMAPRQIWYLKDMTARVEDAIQFFYPPNVSQNIVPIMQMAQGFAEEESGIPLIAAGLSSPQVADTASGQAMIQQASTTLLDFMSEEWDDNITGPLIEAMYAWNMQYSHKQEIKGAYCVDVRTSTEYKNKQLHIRDLEKISVESAQNPELAKWIDQGQLQKMRLEMMNLPSKAVIKSPEQMAEEDAQRAANQGPNPDMLELELKGRKLALEEAQLAFEMSQQQQREQWDHEEKMSANQARLVESQARVAVSQNEKETEILKLAQRSEEAAAKLFSQEKIARENNQTTAFLKGLEETRKQQELDAYNREIDLAKTKGEGV